MSHINKDLTKQLDFAKQQQQLRALGTVGPGSNLKSLSADSMIEDLLSKKETFQKRNADTQQNQELPTWLTRGVHPLYERVWVGVRGARGLCDTPTLSRLLMSSGLSTDTLGYIWSLGNHTVPGSLTQPELYLVLALVGLAQTGYIANNLATVYQLPQPPVPTLDLTLLPTGIVTPNVFPSPLNVTTLPDPVPFSWVSPDSVSTSSPDQIGISYVSSGPMVSPKLLSDQSRNFHNINPQVIQNSSQTFHQQPTQTTNLNITEFNINDNTDQKSILGNNKPVNFTFDPKTISHSKYSSNTHSFSFPSLNDSPSHIANVKIEEPDPFDDEFTDFQSADFTSISAAENKSQSDTIFDDNEFTNFQKASPQLDDGLSVLVVSGKNIPSAQQLWVEDSLSVRNKGEKHDSLEIVGKNDNSSLNLFDNIGVGLSNAFSSFQGSEKHVQAENKYNVFNELEGDKYNVFHNPLPDEDTKYMNRDDKTFEFTEPKSVFTHPLFSESEAPVNLFKNDQAPSLELPKPFIDDSIQKDIAEDDDEFSNFQTFPGSLVETNNVADFGNDKYDIFRTIVFKETVPQEEEDMEMAKPHEPFKPNSTHTQSLNCTTYDFNVMDGSLESEGSSSNNVTERLSREDFHLVDQEFGDFQESSSVSPKSDSKMENLFSSLAISEKIQAGPDSISDPLNLAPSEDKYKALRILEPVSEATEEYGAFNGTDLLNCETSLQSQREKPSVQVRCLEACLNLLKDGLLTLSKASSPEIVSEVLSDSRASTYLDCLLEVQRVSERILRHTDDKRCVALQAELQQVWQSLAAYNAHSEHHHLTESVGAVCGVCRSDTGPSPVTFGGLTFHSPCANLYLHCVEPVLPTIQTH